MSGRELRWTVTAADPRTLSALVTRLGKEAEGALAEGRVFVDGRRARDDQLKLRPGQTVSVSAARRAEALEAVGQSGRSPVPALLTVGVLSERGGLLAVYKPAGLSTEPDRRGSDSLCTRVAALQKLPEAEVHACSRLDHGVSGVVLVATNAAARRHAAQEREQGRILRRYVAIAAAAPPETRGVWQTPVEGREASTEFTCVELSASGTALLALEPRSGRKHQLRVHAARAGAPLLGDEKYGGPRRHTSPNGSVHEIRRVALHAAALTLRDFEGARWRIQAPVAEELLRLWEHVGGSAEAWVLALREDLAHPPEPRR
jgi:23S rRNA pseudouridine1911/1915/1917 synthase